MRIIKRISIFLLFPIGLFSVCSCGNPNYRQRADDLFLMIDNQDYYYELKQPEKKYFLPYILEEISGIGWKEGNILFAVDDETGKVFEYSLEKEDIIHSITFYRGDDFEGVEPVDDHLYVLRSDGDLFKIKYTVDKKARPEKIETDLSKKNDTEGLGYDPERRWLLIACKEKPEIDDKDLDGRAFYAFDLEKKKLKKKPLFTIGLKELENFWESHTDHDYDRDRIKFKPSAIALHPISKNYYILSSVGKMVLITDRDGEIQASYPIAPGVLGQPEGITFASNGDMFISSEGEGDRGYILKFKMNAR
ncbi:MAG: SdiA-regulated domain-containing protein [Ekhidna sp.]|nr:SdiA-regulated domain-containing protein [Ekhidna sp.]